MGTSTSRARRVVGFVWIAFLIRGAFYSAILPLWEGFDEYAHFAFVHHLKTFGALPRYNELVSAEVSRSLRLVPLPWSLNDWTPPALSHDNYWRLSPEERSLRAEGLKNLSADLQAVQEGEFVEEAKQPPSYYILGVPVLRAFSGASLPGRVFALRLFSVLIASLVLPLAFAIALRILGEVQALMITIFIASMPGLLITVSRVGNDCLAMVLFAVLTYALVRVEPWDARGALVIGATLGAGLLTKAYFIAALPATLLSAGITLWSVSSRERLRYFVRLSGAFLLALAVAGWWYIRTLGAGGQVWVDAAPLSSVSSGELLKQVAAMDWWEAVKVILNGHFWIGGWSFLGVRSWIYAILRMVFLVALPAGFLWLIRKSPRFSPIWCLYAGFWIALLYHAFVNFINVGVPASTGWYLYAVVVSEAVLLGSAAQWFGGKYRGYLVVSLTGLFLLLEMYAAHFVLIPYYLGLIGHRANGTLTAFHVSQAVDLGWREILSRILINKTYLGATGVLSLWVMFAFTTACLLIMSWRYAGRSKQDL